jgi:hypothetical protein
MNINILMTDKEYGSLSLDERAAILWDIGIFIDTVDHINQTVKLYSLYSFFVEVYYNMSNRQVEKVGVAGPDELAKYLGRITIELR